jgi:hypothetical protein
VNERFRRRGDFRVIEEFANGVSIDDLESIQAVSIAVFSLYGVSHGAIGFAVTRVIREREAPAFVLRSGSTAHTALIGHLTWRQAGVYVVADPILIDIRFTSSTALEQCVKFVEVAVAVYGVVIAEDSKRQFLTFTA